MEILIIDYGKLKIFFSEVIYIRSIVYSVLYIVISDLELKISC